MNAMQVKEDWYIDVEWKKLDPENENFTDEAMRKFIVDWKRGWLVNAKYYKGVLGSLYINFDESKIAEMKKRLKILKDEKATLVLCNRKIDRPFLVGEENRLFFKDVDITNRKWKEFAVRTDSNVPFTKCECVWHNGADNLIAFCVSNEDLDYEMMNVADIFQLDVEFEDTDWKPSWGHGYIVKFPK